MASYSIGMKFPVSHADVGLRVDDQGRYVSGDSFEFRVASGQVSGYSSLLVSGHNEVVGNFYEPVANGGVWPTPQVADVVQLHIAAGGDINDTAGGPGAREIELFGMDATGAFITELIATNGALASLPTAQSFIRLLGVRVTSSGTYSDTSGLSHAAEIVIESDIEPWGLVPFVSLAHSRSNIGCTTIPLGKTAWITSLTLNVDGTKPTDIVLFKRDNILQTAPPYEPLVVLQEIVSVSGLNSFSNPFPTGPFSQLTDVGLLAKVDQTTASVSVSISFILIDN